MPGWWVMVEVSALDVRSAVSGKILRGYTTSGLVLARDPAELERKAIQFAAQHYKCNDLAGLDRARAPVFRLVERRPCRALNWWSNRLRQRHALRRGGSWWSDDEDGDHDTQPFAPD